MKPELIGVCVVLLGGLAAAVVKYVNVRLERERREDLQAELRDASSRIANAKTEAERIGEQAIYDDILRRMSERGMHTSMSTD